MTIEQIQNNEVLRLSFEFSRGIIFYSQELRSSKHFEIAGQLLRSGTAICANLIEAQGSESTKDFIHKCKIASKEAEEAEYWLLLCDSMPGWPPCKSLLERIRSLNRMVNAIITTTVKRHLKK